MSDPHEQTIRDLKRRYQLFLDRCADAGLDIVTHIRHGEFQISVVGRPDLRFVCRNAYGDILDRSEEDQLSLIDAWIARVTS